MLVAGATGLGSRKPLAVEVAAAVANFVTVAACCSFADTETVVAVADWTVVATAVADTAVVALTDMVVALVPSQQQLVTSAAAFADCGPCTEISDPG